MKILGRCFLFGVACLVIGTLYGCGFLDMVAGVHTNPDGTITTGPGVGDAIGNALSGLLGPYGGMVGLGVGWGLREYRHYRLIQAGKKDDNRDGIDDDTQKIPPFRIDGGSSGTAGGAGGTVKG